MSTCAIETGLLRKKPCGHVAVAMCANCDQPLCAEHAVPQLTAAGHKTGKVMCKECVAAAKEHAKSMAAVARAQEARKIAALDRTLREQASAPAAPKKPAASAPQAPAEPAPAEKPKEPEALEFTPSGGKPGDTKKEDKPG
jgi:hypothetical protein